MNLSKTIKELSFYIVFFVAVIILTGALSLSLSSYHSENKSYEEALTEFTEKVETLKEENCNLNKQYSELEKLRATYEASRARNKEDLMDFISENYGRVPVEVAEVIAEKTEDLCIKHGVNFNLVVGIMGVESDFDPSAVSTAKARGLMQVRFSIWAKELGLEDPYTLHGIETGIEAGIRVLKHYLDKAEGNTTSALSMYNGSGKGKSDYSDKVYKEIGRFVVSKKGVATNGDSEEQDSEQLGDVGEGEQQPG